MTAGDVEAYRRLLADDVVLDDRRAGIAARITGRDDVVAVTGPDVYPADVPVTIDIETVAARRDDLVLQHCTIRQLDGDGPTMEWLSVSSWRDGVLDRSVVFHPDDHTAALEELDRLLLEHGDER